MYKLAVISDIHGNYKALEAFLQYMEQHPVDGIIALGDYVTDSPYPEKTMGLIYGMMDRYPCYMIRGNREDYLLGNPNNCQGWKPSSVNGVLFYTWKHIREQDMQFFACIPTEREVKIEGCQTLFVCHGTPGSVRGNVTEEPGLREKVLQETKYSYVLGGHSHWQEIYCQDGKTYLNPGSLGLAMDGVGRRAQFAILSSDESPIEQEATPWQVELLSIDYDVDGFLEDFTRSGVDTYGMTLNKAVKKSLVTGINYFYKCIVAMQELAEKKGVTNIAELSEDEWKKLEQRFDL